MKVKSNLLLTTMAIFALALSSCGASNNSIIATSVALTVQAQDTQSASVTDTPLPLETNLPPVNTPTGNTPIANTPSANTVTAPLPTFTPLGSSLAVSTSVTKFCTAGATFTGETVPDGTIENPGATFTKTWDIENTGTCTWDSTWKLIYISGDLMGAAASYPLTYTPPNQTLNFSVVLTAPATEGTDTGYWKLESPWGLVFGDSDSGNPFWVTINVNSGTAGPNTPSVYGITSVTYDYSISYGKSGSCSPNVFLTTSATVTASGPMKVYYSWSQSDGGHSGGGTITFTEAGTQTVQDTWPLSAGHEIGIRWEDLVVTSPIRQDFQNLYARYDHECQ